MYAHLYYFLLSLDLQIATRNRKVRKHWIEEGLNDPNFLENSTDTWVI